MCEHVLRLWHEYQFRTHNTMRGKKKKKKPENFRKKNSEIEFSSKHTEYRNKLDIRIRCSIVYCLNVRKQVLLIKIDIEPYTVESDGKQLEFVLCFLLRNLL